MTFRFTLGLLLAFACCLDAAAQAPDEGSAERRLSLSLSTSLPGLPGLRTPDEGGTIAPGLHTDALPVFELSPDPLSSDIIDLTIEQEDLFVRLRSGFSMPDISNDLVLYHQQWYLNRPDYLRRMIERSRRYLHFIVEEIEKRGMPTELALLPMVESAYNPMAYSSAKASGLWQFIPSTGKNFKLQQNWWVDQRRDVIASTSAALDYLQTIYEMHGDWQLALASYNWGEGAVGRAVAKNRARGLPTDYLSLTLPPETRHYIPKLQALKNIISNPQLMAQLGLSQVPNRPYFTTVAWPANIDISVAAQLAEMPVDEFVALNPAHNRPVITADTPLVLPANKVATFMTNLEKRQGREEPLSFWQTYTLRAGEKLEKLAPRFGMTIANLKAVNGINGRIRISPGFTLLIPAPDGAGTMETAALLKQPRLPDADPEPQARTHLVRKGDTLASVAHRYGIAAATLKKLNRLSSEKLTPGTKLALGAAPARASTAASGKPGATGERVHSTLPARGEAKATGKAAKSVAKGASKAAAKPVSSTKASAKPATATNAKPATKPAAATKAAAKNTP